MNTRMTSLLSVVSVLALAGAAIATPARVTRQAPLSATVGEDRSGPRTLLTNPAVRADEEPGLNPNAVVLWLTVFHGNDFESKLTPIVGGAANGYAGAAQWVAKLNQLRGQVATVPADPNGPARGSILVSSGDNILPGVNLNASLALPFGTPFYDTLFFQAADFDGIALGNHDFDLTPSVLTRFIGSFNQPVQFLSSNLNFAGEPGLQAFVPSRLAKSTVVNVAGFNVGIIGATTEALPFISQPGGAFSGPVLAAVQQEANTLTANGVSIILLSSHLQGLTSEFNLIAQLDNVDAVIGGGGSELLAKPGTPLVPGDVINTQNIGGTSYPRSNTDINGTVVPLVTTAGDFKYIGRLILGFNSAGELVQIANESNVVRVAPVGQPDGVAPDATVKSTVEDPINAYRAVLANTIVGTTAFPLNGANNATGIRVFEQNLGNLLADSMLYQAAVTHTQFGAPAPTMAITNGGGIRAGITGPNISVLNTFDVAPFNNTLVIVPSVTPARLKQILENCVANVQGTPGGGADTGRFGQIAGFRFSWNPNGQRQLTTTVQVDPFTSTNTITQQGTRVVDVQLFDGTYIIRNGQIVPGAPNVNIATLDFLARGGDQYPLTDLTNIRLGATTYQVTLQNYITQWLGGTAVTPTVSNINYPVGGEGRITRVP